MKKFEILVSRTAENFLKRLDEKTKNRIKDSIKNLEENPFVKRSGMDIKQLIGNKDPVFYRLRIGEYRAIYVIKKKKIKITEIMRREKGYDWMQ